MSRAVHPVLMLAVLAVAAPRAVAVPIVLYETGFEASEGFVAGQALVGQGGFVARLGLNPAAAAVVAERALTGSQAVRVAGSLLTERNPVGSFAGGYHPLLNYDFVANNTPIIEISVDVLLVVLADVEQDIEAGLSAYDGQGNSFGALVLGGPDAPAGEYGYFNLRAVYDFATGIGQLYIDGEPGAPGELDRGDGLINPAIVAFGEEVPPRDFVAYFDNFRVTASAAPVPEPSTLALGGIGGLLTLGVAWRRRKRAA